MSEAVNNIPSWEEQLSPQRTKEIRLLLKELDSKDRYLTIDLIRSGSQIAVASGKKINLPVPLIQVTPKEVKKKRRPDTNIAFRLHELHRPPYEVVMETHRYIINDILGFPSSQYEIREERKHAKWEVVAKYLQQKQENVDHVIFATGGNKKDGFNFAAYGIYPKTTNQPPLAG